MTDKFRNKYRVPSTRLQNWDYRSPGAYYITICTHNRECCFGELIDEKMILSHIGIVADILWYQILRISKNIQLGPFVVMPNHVHGILIITENVEEIHSNNDIVNDNTTFFKNEYMSKISPKKNSVSAIIRSYKSAITYHVHRLGFGFQWQPRFYDYIIRDEIIFQRIAKYIRDNPANWEKDRFYKNNF